MSCKIFFFRSLPAIIFSALAATIAVFAWTEPSAAPPANNVQAPINVSNINQYKAGSLGLGGVLRGYSDALFDGYLGVNTVSPKQNLDVNGMSVYRDNMYFGSGPTGNIGTVSWQGSVFQITAQNGKKLSLGSNDTPDRLYIDSNGNVGVGNINPGYKLDVTGKANATELCIAGDCKSSWPVGGGGGGGGNFGNWQVRSANTVYLAATDGFVVAWAYSFSGASGLLEGFTDNSNPPTTKRVWSTDVWSGSQGGITFPVRQGDYWKVSDTNPGTNITVYFISTPGGGGGAGVAGSGNVNYISKWTSSSSIGDSQIFDNGTRVGIGTASPNYRLDVQGGDVNVSGNFLRGGVAGLSVSCGGGQFLQNPAVSGGIITGGACAAAGGGGGDVTAVYNGTGLSGGGVSEDVTLSLNTAAIGACTDAANNKIIWDSGNSRLTCGTDQVGGGGGGGGNVSTPGGTPNRLAKFTAGTNIGDSSVFDNGVFTGVGITTPDGAERMRVNGNFRAEGDINTNNAGFLRAGSMTLNYSASIGGDLGIGGSGGNIYVKSISPVTGWVWVEGKVMPGGGLTGPDASTPVVVQPPGLYVNGNINTSGSGGIYAGTGSINNSFTVGSLCLSGVCNSAWPGGGGGGIGGSGSANYIPKFTAGTTLGNSQIYDNGNVGIGTASPSVKLHVQGNIRAEGDINTNAAGGIYAGTGAINNNFSVGNLCLSGQCRNTWATAGSCAGQVMVAINSNGTPVCEPDDVGGGGGLSTWQASANIGGGAGTQSAVASCGGGKVLGGGFDIRGGHTIYSSRPSGSNAWQCIVVKNNSENDTCYAVCAN